MLFGTVLTLMFQRTLRKTIHTVFPFFQSLGIHITHNHFYEPIPDTRHLKNSLWRKDRFLTGINFQEKKQKELLKEFKKKYKREYDALPINKTDSEYFINNGMFESVDGEILYCMVRDLKPDNIIEIGSGYSTLLMSLAVERNEKGILTVIDPYPQDIYTKGSPNIDYLVKKKVEDVPFQLFEKLNENDILFIDSSHVGKLGSDVQYEILELFPRLKKGVVIHIHDIFLPSEYPKRAVLKDYVFWNEQYLLHAFLQFNNSFEVLWGGSFMHLFNSELLEKTFKSYTKKRWPGSFWMKKTQ